MQNHQQRIVAVSEKIETGTYIIAKKGEADFFKKGDRGICLGKYLGSSNRVPHYVFVFENGGYTDLTRGEANHFFTYQDSRSSKLENYQFKRLTQVADDVAKGMFNDVWCDALN